MRLFWLYGRPISRESRLSSISSLNISPLYKVPYKVVPYRKACISHSLSTVDECMRGVGGRPLLSGNLRRMEYDAKRLETV